MSSLNDQDMKRMYQEEPSLCPFCGNTLHKNYCRECDEYFMQGHKPDCQEMKPGLHSDNHTGHRTY